MYWSRLPRVLKVKGSAYSPFGVYGPLDDDADEEEPVGEDDRGGGDDIVAAFRSAGGR